MKELKQIAKKLKEADAVLIGASNGLSITEGLHLFAADEAFQNLFGDLKVKYGLRCILHGMGAQWPAEEEKWGFWSRLVHHYCCGYTATPVMQDLKAIVGEKDYFIVTSNGECHFEMSGFAPENIYEVEGNWLTMQCAKPCHDKIYPAFDTLEEMAAEERGGKIPSHLIPRCPRCGGPMEIHMAGGPWFLEDSAAKENFLTFIKKYHNKRIVILELGIGPRNRIIKEPLMQLTAMEPNYTYVTINLGELYIPKEIREKSFGLDGGLEPVLSQLKEACLRIFQPPQ